MDIVEGRFPSVEDLTGPHRVKVTINYTVDTFFTIESDLNIDNIIGNYEEGVTAESHVDAGNTVVLDSLTLPDGHILESVSGTKYPLDYTPPDANTNTDTTTSGGGGGGGGCFISTINK